MADEEITQATTEFKSKRNVLLAVDGSEGSKRALEFYLKNMATEGDNVTVFHAIEIPPLPAAAYPYGYAYQETYQASVKAASDHATAVLLECRPMFENVPGIKFKLIKQGGRPGEIICKNIEDEGASIVIMGTRGQGTIRRTLLGSVSDYVVHHSHVAVCIVPSEPKQ